MARELTPAERQALRGRAHRLHPVVRVGSAGVTRAVVAEVECALRAQPLVKISVSAADRVRRQALVDELCAAIDAVPVQQIGKILVLYRDGPAEHAPEPPPRTAPPGAR